MAFSIHVVVGVRLQRHVDHQSRSASAVDVRGAFKSGWSLMGLSKTSKKTDALILFQLFTRVSV